MPRDIEELDQDAHRMRITWRKANNFYVSFVTQFMDTKKLFADLPFGPEWTFERFLLRKCGMFEDQILAQLRNHMKTASEEDRQKVEEENERIATEKRTVMMRQAAEKRAAASERRAALQHRKREQQAVREAAREAKEAARLEATAAKIAAAEAAQAAAAAEQAEAKKRQSLDKAKERREARKKELLAAGPADPDLQRLLVKCNTIEATSRVELGACYHEMKDLVQMHRAGKDEDGKIFTWVKYVNTYIQRSYRDVDKCIVEFLENRASCPVSPSENVVEFPKNIVNY